MNNHIPRTWFPPIAHSQGQAFTTKQAIAAGMKKGQVSYRLKNGTFQRAAGAALHHRDSPITPRMLAFAAHLTWPDTLLCGPTVVQLYNIPINTLEAHVISTFRRKPLHGLVQHEFAVAPWEVEYWNGIPATSLSRSLLDSLVLLPKRSAQSLFVWSYTRNRLTIPDFEVHLERYPNRWGNARLRSFLANAREGIMSPAEALLHKILRAAGFTGWQADATINHGSKIMDRVDVLFTSSRLIVEVDGRKYHGEDRFQLDRTRDNRLHAAGYRVLRFTWADLTQRPGLIVRQVRELTR